MTIESINDRWVNGAGEHGNIRYNSNLRYRLICIGNEFYLLHYQHNLVLMDIFRIGPFKDAESAKWYAEIIQ